MSQPNKPKQASQISINADRLAKKKRKEVDELIEMEKRRMMWFEVLCVNPNLPNTMR